MSILWRLVILLALTAGVWTHILRLACKLEGHFVKNETQIRVQSPASVVIATNSPHACIAECLKSTTCKTINHNLEIKACELNVVNTTDVGATITSTTSWVHYSTIWNRTKIGTNCITKSTCNMNRTAVCRDICSARGYRCFCKSRYVGENCELYAANSKVTLNEPLTSCAHLKKLLPQAVSDYYYVQWLSSYRKVYCDMKVDGGGWMMVANLSFIPGPKKNLRWLSDISTIGSFEDGITIFTPNLLNRILNITSFREVRLYCRKSSLSSRTVHIKVTSNEVIEFLTGQTNTRPSCVGTFVRLPGDDSNLSKGCTNSRRWDDNKWSGDSVDSSDDRLTYKLINFWVDDSAFSFFPSWELYECDDYKSQSNYQIAAGLWQYFVR